jgi:hypothetical protein
MGRHRKITHVFNASIQSHNATGRHTKLMLVADSLNVGETLYIAVEEWTATGFKTDPTVLVHSSSHHPRALVYQKKFSVEKLKNGKLITGWLITRKR